MGYVSHVGLCATSFDSFIDMMPWWLRLLGLSPRAHIVKRGSKYVLFSKDGSQKLGEFDTREEALKRERQIEYFKHNG